ncbi:hypothetical protein M0534_06780 [Methylonatrum kenyense]|uniref:hypothetical protein n=1 Tax=Methylonatrum kenyense TaxID=455253 RepID=UPI0020C069AE|nr:hypothetical protein [Methylonatrum kenyense]MCK8516029.1 hypothetical protein [Methylonatrum kenyense]
MNKQIIAGLSASALLLAGSAMAGDDEVTIDLTGEIEEVCTVSLDGDNNVDVELLDSSTQNLGTLTYNCNVKAGFTRTISSQNDGSMVNDFGFGFSSGLPYQVRHTGEGVGTGFGFTSLSTPNTRSVLSYNPGSPWNPQGDFASGPQQRSGDLSLRMTNPPSDDSQAWAGEYSDTITVSVNAN